MVKWRYLLSSSLFGGVGFGLAGDYINSAIQYNSKTEIVVNNIFLPETNSGYNMVDANELIKRANEWVGAIPEPSSLEALAAGAFLTAAAYLVLNEKRDGSFF